ncbi:hypothetical protein DIPPA_25397 [Diplonema papillatum]|nr:hypothetical protein DIPPA_25397 [Diplonema papillatum]
MLLYQPPEERKTKKQQQSNLEDALGIFSQNTIGLALRHRRAKAGEMRVNPLTHTKVKAVENLTKAHQMEGDGLLLLLYFHLFKKTWNSKKEFQSCPGARWSCTSTTSRSTGTPTTRSTTSC